jgi:hypothetical protein
LAAAHKTRDGVRDVKASVKKNVVELAKNMES